MYGPRCVADFSSSVAAPRAQPRVLFLRSRRSTSNCTHFLQQRIDPHSSFLWLRVDSCSLIHGGAYSLCQLSGGSALSPGPPSRSSVSTHVRPCLAVAVRLCPASPYASGFAAVDRCCHGLSPTHAASICVLPYYILYATCHCVTSHLI
jgi:hypothetical protein